MALEKIGNVTPVNHPPRHSGLFLLDAILRNAPFLFFLFLFLSRRSKVKRWVFLGLREFVG